MNAHVHLLNLLAKQWNSHHFIGPTHTRGRIRDSWWHCCLDSCLSILYRLLLRVVRRRHCVGGGDPRSKKSATARRGRL